MDIHFLYNLQESEKNTFFLLSEEKIGVQRHKVFCIWTHNYDVRSLGCKLETIGLHSPFFSTIVHALNYYLCVVMY